MLGKWYTRRRVLASNTPLCQLSPGGWLLLLAEMCRRSDNIHVNQQMCGLLEINVSLPASVVRIMCNIRSPTLNFSLIFQFCCFWYEITVWHSRWCRNNSQLSRNIRFGHKYELKLTKLQTSATELRLYSRSQVMSGPNQVASEPTASKHLAVEKPIVTYPR